MIRQNTLEIIFEAYVAQVPYMTSCMKMTSIERMFSFQMIDSVLVLLLLLLLEERKYKRQRQKL